MSDPEPPSRPAPRFLSPRDFGAAIGVSESSVKRWADDGQLRIVKTRGGHRRIRVAEAVRWIQSHGHALVRPELLGLPDRMRLLERRPAADHARSLERFLAEGRLDEARALLLHAFVGGLPLVALGSEVLQPALEAVRELWHHGPDGIAVEHAATEACAQALHEIQRMLPEARGPTALGGAPEGDPYQLPSLLAAMTLQGAGWRATNLGADLPLAALLASCERLQPRLVWLSLSATRDPGSARAYVAAAATALAARGPLLVVGGRASDALDLPLVRVERSLARLVEIAADRAK